MALFLPNFVHADVEDFRSKILIFATTKYLSTTDKGSPTSMRFVSQAYALSFIQTLFRVHCISLSMLSTLPIFTVITIFHGESSRWSVGLRSDPLVDEYDGRGI